MKTLVSFPNENQFFNFEKNKNQLPKNFKLYFKKSKIIKTSPSSEPLETCIGIKSRIKEKNYFQDAQDNIIDFNIIKNYHKVFKNGEKNLYSNEYLKSVTNLLHKNERNYFFKRIQLDVNKQNNTLKRGKSYFYFSQENVTKEGENFEYNKGNQICNIYENKKITKEDYDKYSLNDSYHSNESVELSETQVREIKNNLAEKYSFLFPEKKKNKQKEKDNKTLPIIIKNTNKVLKIQKNEFKNIENKTNSSLQSNKNLTFFTESQKIENNQSLNIKKILDNLYSYKEHKINKIEK